MMTRKFGYERSLRQNEFHTVHQFMSLRKLRKNTREKYAFPQTSNIY